MRRESRANQAALRRAVWASVALHGVAACVFLLFLRTGEEPKARQGRIDTHAADEPQVRMHLTLDEAPVSMAAPPQPPSQAAPESKIVKPVEAPAPALPNGPVAPATPRTLPPELLALLRKPAVQVSGGMPEVPAAPAPPGTAATDPNVKPAGGTTGSAPAGTSVRAIHGALKPEQTVVYVLDSSGSMGAAGKFDAARAALLATLRRQPPTARFQVIVYAGSAVPLLTSDNRGLPATAANIQAAAEKLAALEPRGQSSHLAAVRAALAFRPDVILILTDADDLAPAALKKLLASAPKPVPVCVARATPEGVGPPREVK
jgi:hypothetical protein